MLLIQNPLALVDITDKKKKTKKKNPYHRWKEQKKMGIEKSEHGDFKIIVFSIEIFIYFSILR